MNREWRDLQDFCCFFRGEADEKPKFDDPAHSRLNLLKLGQCFVESNEIGAALFGKDEVFIQR